MFFYPFRRTLFPEDFPVVFPSVFIPICLFFFFCYRPPPLRYGPGRRSFRFVLRPLRLATGAGHTSLERLGALEITTVSVILKRMYSHTRSVCFTVTLRVFEIKTNY